MTVGRNRTFVHLMPWAPKMTGLKREMIDLKIQEHQVPGGAQVLQEEDHNKQERGTWPKLQKGPSQ